MSWNQQFSLTEQVCTQCKNDGKKCREEVETFLSQNYGLQKFLQNEIQDIFYLHNLDELSGPWDVSVGLVELSITLSTFPCRVHCN